MMDKHQPPFYVVEGEDSTATIFDAKHRPLTADGAVALLNAPPAGILGPDYAKVGRAVVELEIATKTLGSSEFRRKEELRTNFKVALADAINALNPPAADKQGETK